MPLRFKAAWKHPVSCHFKGARVMRCPAPCRRDRGANARDCFGVKEGTEFLEFQGYWWDTTSDYQPWSGEMVFLEAFRLPYQLRTWDLSLLCLKRELWLVFKLRYLHVYIGKIEHHSIWLPGSLPSSSWRLLYGSYHYWFWKSSCTADFSACNIC